VRKKIILIKLQREPKEYQSAATNESQIITRFDILVVFIALALLLDMNFFSSTTASQRQNYSSFFQYS
jgi:hypothetical protein